MSSNLLLLLVTIFVALAFDFLNGFHDAANSIATVVSTRVLSPKLAVVWAAFFNFVAAFLLGTAVAKTIGKGMVQIDSVTQYVVICGLLGAIVWDLLTWWWALPTSSSHALIGGYAGAAIMRSGFHVIIIEGWYKTLIFIVVAPIMGLVLAFCFMVAIFWLLRDAWRIALVHILPNILPSLAVQASLSIAAAIIAEASLSFLGLGQQPPDPSWGSMLNAAQRFLSNAPWLAIFPGLAIFLTVMSFNLLGDGLRDALDPRER